MPREPHEAVRRFSDQENVRRAHKSGAAKKLREPARLKRIPLGGKDSNSGIPTLSRSNTTIDVSRPKVGLARSNSSLGLVAPSVSESRRLLRSENTVFNPRSATRPPELVQPDDTDSLRKRILHRDPGVAGTLPETMSPRTDELSSAHVVSRRIPGDPVKTPLKRSRTDSLERASLVNKLSEQGIEYAPDSVAVDYTPMDSEPITDQVISVISGKVKRPMSASLEELDLVNFNFDENDDNDNDLGMNEQDLNELLDF